MQQTHYDYIITGAGCSGLSLAVHMVQQESLRKKRILLLDEAPKNTNDRTWCFWEKEPGLFESIVHKQWDTLWFHGDNFSKALPILPYRYKMVRGLDFYQHCFSLLKNHSQVEFVQCKVDKTFSGKVPGVVAGGKTYTANYVFNSIPPQNPVLAKKDVWLLQHFKGWIIETEKPVFSADEATLMDFRVSQENGTAFCYVLPVSPTRALVEYTLFTASLLPDQAYDAALRQYISEFLHLQHYHVAETEFGVIPMTNYRFSRGAGNVVNIGTAGGQTKGSSGYTFYFIQQHCKRIVEKLAKGEHPGVSTTPGRFHFYDSVLLDVLAHHRMPGKEIFTQMFRKNKPQDVLSFLNNATSLPMEAGIIASLPTLPFLKAALHQLT